MTDFEIILNRGMGYFSLPLSNFMYYQSGGF